MTRYLPFWNIKSSVTDNHEFNNYFYLCLPKIHAFILRITYILSVSLSNRLNAFRIYVINVAIYIVRVH